jgi:hypothetical protein
VCAAALRDALETCTRKVEVRDIALHPGQATKPHVVMIDPVPDDAAGK